MASISSVSNKFVIGFTADTTQMKSQLDAATSGYTKTAKTITTKVTLDGEQYTKTTKTLINETENTSAKLVTIYDKSGKEITSGFTQMSTGAKSLGQAFDDVIAKVGKFLLATMVINEVRKAMTEAINVVKEYDAALTDFKKVSDLSGDSLNTYAEKLGDLGTSVARTRKKCA